MTPTEELVAHLKHFEGFVGHCYRDVAGYLTIGYGHRLDEPRPDMTEPEATALLLEDISQYTLMACRISPTLVDAAPRRLNAIIDFCFNCGGHAYASSILKLQIDRQAWALAAAQNARWVDVTDPVTKVKHVSQWQVQRRAVTSAWLRDG